MATPKLLKEFLKNKKNLELRNQLIEKYYPLVKKITHKFKYYPCTLEKADLFQERIFGLIKALNQYEEGSGYDFSTYATPIVNFAIREMIRKNHSLSVPRDTLAPPITSWQEETHFRYVPRTLNPHQLCMQEIYQEQLKEVLEKILSPYEFKVLILSFRMPWVRGVQLTFTKKEIAQKLNLTFKQVGDFKKHALDKMKKNPEIRKLCYQLFKLSNYSN